MNEDLDGHYELKYNLNFQDKSNWVPIGYADSHEFTGIFNGGNRSIRNFRSIQNSVYSGLFGKTYKAKINANNTTLDLYVASGTSIKVSESDYANVTYSTVSGTADAYYYPRFNLGSDYNHNFTRSVATLKTTYAGSLIGYATYSSIKNVRAYSTNNSAVYAFNAGGIVGGTNGNDDNANSDEITVIEACSSNVDVFGEIGVGFYSNPNDTSMSGYKVLERLGLTDLASKYFLYEGTSSNSGTSGGNAGGIVGYSYGTINIKNSISGGKVVSGCGGDGDNGGTYNVTMCLYYRYSTGGVFAALQYYWNSGGSGDYVAYFNTFAGTVAGYGGNAGYGGGFVGYAESAKITGTALEGCIVYAASGGNGGNAKAGGSGANGVSSGQTHNAAQGANTIGKNGAPGGRGGNGGSANRRVGKNIGGANSLQSSVILQNSVSLTTFETSNRAVTGNGGNGGSGGAGGSGTGWKWGFLDWGYAESCNGRKGYGGPGGLAGNVVDNSNRSGDTSNNSLSYQGSRTAGGNGGTGITGIDVAANDY